MAHHFQSAVKRVFHLYFSMLRHQFHSADPTMKTSPFVNMTIN